MEMKQPVKFETLLGGASLKNDTPNYQYMTGNMASSTGFMDLLNMQDMINISPCLHDMMMVMGMDGYGYGYDDNNAFMESLAPDPNVNTESCEVLNNNNSNNIPTTPNSSSISSASNENEAHNDDQQHGDDDDQRHGDDDDQRHGDDDDQRHGDDVDDGDDEEQNKAKKQCTKAKKTNEKRQREPRFAFMTKSEVDHLEDGYRWRKYGQKAVKNSPFPRSYYRCTTASCNVKKRVERSFTDPSIVVTTYEGQHTHPCTVLPRGVLSGTGFGVGIGATSPYTLPVQMANNHHFQMNNYVGSLVPQFNQFGNAPSQNNSTCVSSTTSALLASQERRIASASSSASLLRDDGLLQDIVPSIMKKEEWMI